MADAPLWWMVTSPIVNITDPMVLVLFLFCCLFMQEAEMCTKREHMQYSMGTFMVVPLWSMVTIPIAITIHHPPSTMRSPTIHHPPYGLWFGHEIMVIEAPIATIHHRG
jgi:hypothetical protein